MPQPFRNRRLRRLCQRQRGRHARSLSQPLDEAVLACLGDLHDPIALSEPPAGERR